MCSPLTSSSARVDQARDVRISQPPEDDAFAPEPLLAAPADERCVQQLDRHLPFIAAVAAPAEPHAAHAAVTDAREQRVGADRDAAERGIVLRDRRRVQESFSAQLAMLGKHRGEIGGHLRIGGAQVLQPCLALERR